MSIVQTNAISNYYPLPYSEYEISVPSDLTSLPTTGIAAGSLAYTPMGTRYKLSAAGAWVFDSGWIGGAYDNAGNLKHTVTITQGANSTLAVTVGETPIATGSLQIAGTVLTITFAPATNYDAVCTVNGVAFTPSGGTVTVPLGFDVAIVTTATLKQYALTLTEGDNTTLTATSGEGATLVTYESGDLVTHGTELTVTAAPADGYTLSTFTIGGVDKLATNPATHTMVAAVTVVTAATGT